MAETTRAASDWGAVAAAWDASIDDVDGHAEATAAMFDALRVGRGERVLELAAGPGALGGHWSRLVGNTGSVVLSDIAPEMVDAARRRNASFDNVELAVLDASAIDLPDGSVDVVACRMGLMFAPDPGAAFAEIRRVLRPGGRFAALTWGAIDQNPWMTCVGMAAMMSGLVSGGPPTGPGQIFSLGDPTIVASFAPAAGLLDVEVVTIPAPFHAHSIDAHVERVSAMAGPIARAFATATDEQLAAVRRTAAQLAGDHITTDGVELPGLALLACGRAPGAG